MLIHPGQNQFEKPERAKYNLKNCKISNQGQEKNKEVASPHPL